MIIGFFFLWGLWEMSFICVGDWRSIWVFCCCCFDFVVVIVLIVLTFGKVLGCWLFWGEIELLKRVW